MYVFLPQFLVPMSRVDATFSFFFDTSYTYGAITPPPQMDICLTETTLFYHLLRVTNTLVSHPTTKYGTGLIANWADNVGFAASARHTPTGVPSSATLSSSALVTNASATRTDSPIFTVYQPQGLELDTKDEILAYLDPEHNLGLPNT